MSSSRVFWGPKAFAIVPSRRIELSLNWMSGFFNSSSKIATGWRVSPLDSLMSVFLSFREKNKKFQTDQFIDRTERKFDCDKRNKF
jgi:hypothetical protein